MTVKQLSVFVENKQGMLKDIVNAISGSDVNIRAMSIADTKDYGILRLIVSDIEKAKKALTEDCLSSVNEVIAVGLDDKAGSLADILNILGENNIDIDYLYAFTARTDNGAYVVLRVADTNAAEAVLAARNVPMLSDGDLKNI